VTDSLTFQELIARLPAGSLTGTNQPAFGVERALQTFVPPTFRIVEPSQEPLVILISARGATGKSTVARQLSAVTSKPLWRLDDDLNVSADALESKMRRYLGGDDDPLERARQTPGAAIIVDALDEARVRVSGRSWDEYIASLIGAAHQGLPFVLLARERVLEDVWLSFSDGGLEPYWFEISHFDRQQRHAYVDGQVQAKGEDTTSETYTAARDAVLAALEGTVSGPDSEAFVGYAPVLDAVVALLVKANLISIQNSFGAEAHDDESVSVLIQVLISLLEREQEKTAKFVQQLGLNPALAYTPEEQLDWLAHELLGSSAPPLDWCPLGIRGEYANQLQQFLEDHPFRSDKRWSSPVFSAYVVAQRFSDPEIRQSLRPVAGATGLLFEFVSHDGAAEMIDEWQFAALHASLLAAEWHDIEAVVAVSGGDISSAGDQIGSATGELILVAEGVAKRRTSFELVLEKAGQLSIMGPVAFLAVEFPGKVVIDSGHSSVTLGPDCYIRCVDLQLRGDNIQILRQAQVGQEGFGEEPSVVLEATTRFGCEAALSNTSVETFELFVSDAQRLPYPWVTYRRSLEPVATEPDERAVRFLNRLMTLVRKHGRKEMGVFDKKLEGVQSIKGGELVQVLGQLEQMGVITVNGSLIFLNEDWAAERFDGKGRPGMASLEDKMEVWKPVLERIAQTLR
jgi:hypothetical protein